MSGDNSGDRFLMISMKTTVFTLIFFLIVFVSVFVNFYSNQNESFESKTEDVDVFLVEQNEQLYYDDDPDDYAVGFQAGKFALYSQLNIEYQPEEAEVFAYSSFVEENNDPKYFENIEYDKGYVDGYHRATEQIYCPASVGHKWYASFLRTIS